MTDRLVSSVRAFGIKRLVVLALGAGSVTLFFDAWVGHLADGVLEHPSQGAAVVVPLVSALALLGVSIPRVGPTWFGRVTAIVGWFNVLTGAAGTFFHLKSLLGQFAEAEEITVQLVRDSLGVSPPVFAPAAFVGVGTLLVVLASPRLRVEVDAAPASEPAIEPAKA